MSELLKVQAAECLSAAETALQTPDQIQIFSEQEIAGPGEARLWLHSQIAAGIPEFRFMNETSRWIYLYVDGEPGPHTSFDMNSLTSDGLRGITDRNYDLPEIANSFRGMSQNMAASIIEHMYRFIQGDTSIARDIDQTFIELMAAGSTDIIKHRTVSLTNQSRVGLQSRTQEGIFLKPHFMFDWMPRLAIAVASPELEGYYIVEDRDGFPECLIETEEFFEKLEGIVDESQIIRNDSGNISITTGDTRDAESAVIEMYRAAGLRDVRSEVIDEVYPRAMRLLEYVRNND